MFSLFLYSTSLQRICNWSEDEPGSWVRIKKNYLPPALQHQIFSLWKKSLRLIFLESLIWVINVRRQSSWCAIDMVCELRDWEKNRTRQQKSQTRIRGLIEKMHKTVFLVFNRDCVFETSVVPWFPPSFLVHQPCQELDFWDHERKDSFSLRVRVWQKGKEMAVVSLFLLFSNSVKLQKDDPQSHYFRRPQTKRHGR